jgi:hypothetical protein
MPFSITNSNGTLLVIIPDGTINNTATDLTLFGNNAPNFGQATNQNFINLLQNFASDNSPSLPSDGQIWYDESTTILKLYNDSAWDILSQPINLSAAYVPIPLTNYSGNPSILVSICNDLIVAVSSTIMISQNYLPQYLLLNSKPYLFAPLFSNGIQQGITLGTNASIFCGVVTVANEFVNKSNIILSGAVYSNVLFDGSSNVNLNVSFSNVYVGNSNVSVGGYWSNVTVSNYGQIINFSNVAYNDIVTALQYTPVNSNLATSEEIAETLVLRDQNNNFSANIISATVSNTYAFINDSEIIISGAALGVSQPFDSSANIIVETNLIINTNVSPGVYNTIGVDGNGFIQSAQFIDNIPIGSIVLYKQTFIPNGWVACNGQNVTLPDGYEITTPNLSNAIVGFVNNANLALVFGSIVITPNGNISIPNSNLTVEAVYANEVGAEYIMHIYSDQTVYIGNATPGKLEVNLLAGNIQQIELIGGANIVYPPLVYSGNIVPQSITSEQIVGTFVESVDFGNNPFYDAASLLLSSGDTNAVMMCATDIFGDLSQLVVQQVLYNLQNRHLQGLPPRIGKYMLSQQDIIDYIGILELPIDVTFFTIALQDELMLLKVSDISNRMIAANVYPDDAKLFGAVYIGYGQYLTIIQADSFSTVGAALISGGYAVTGDAYTDNLYCYQFIDSIENLISVAENTIIQNQTAILVVSELNSILTNQSYTVPPSLIQQSISIAGNVYDESNVSIITVDGMQNYYGGNVNVSPGFGGGAFPYTSSIASTAYYTTIAKSRYLGAIISTDANNNLSLSRATGIGINVGNTTNTQIGDLATTIGVVNIVVGPIDSPQPSQEILQNSFITNRIISPGASIQTQITTTVTPPAVTPVTTSTVVVAPVVVAPVVVAPAATPPTKQVTTQYITKIITYNSLLGQTVNSISYNVVTVGNTIYPDGTTMSSSSSSHSNVNVFTPEDSNSTVIDIETVIS